MSEEKVGGVRTPVTVPSGTRSRTLDERILVRFPALARLFNSAWSRLPPRSRLRQAILSRLVRQGCEAFNRRDFQLILTAIDPVFELHFKQSEGLVIPDLVGVHRGHNGYIKVWRTTLEASKDTRLEPDELVDFGDQVLVVNRQKGHGNLSSAPYDQALFQVFTWRRGLLIRQEDFNDRAEALEAAGLSESGS